MKAFRAEPRRRPRHRSVRSRRAWRTRPTPLRFPRRAAGLVARSNAFAQILLSAGAVRAGASLVFGIPGYDDQVFDLKPKVDERFRAAMAQAKAELAAKLAVEKDPNVRQDLQILIDAADRKHREQQAQRAVHAAVGGRGPERVHQPAGAASTRPARAPRAPRAPAALRRHDRRHHAAGATGEGPLRRARGRCGPDPAEQDGSRAGAGEFGHLHQRASTTCSPTTRSKARNRRWRRSESNCATTPRGPAAKCFARARDDAKLPGAGVRVPELKQMGIDIDPHADPARRGRVHGVARGDAPPRAGGGREGA